MSIIKQRTLLLGLLALSVSAAQAITFSAVVIQSAPLSNGSSFIPSANAISFFTPNAIVGDPVAPLRSGTLNIQYDANNAVSMISNQVNVTLGAALSGSGSIFFTELIMELDNAGNELGLIGFISHTFTPSSSTVFTGSIPFSKPVKAFRAKKAFTMSAVDTQALDLAAVAIVNQNIQTVPEPATMFAVAAGLAAIARRRKS